jgi:hypothetical protein
LPRATPLDSGEFATNLTQALSTDPQALKSAPGLAARTFDPELSIPTTSRAPLYLGAAVLFVLLVGGALIWVGRNKSAQPGAEAGAAASGSALGIAKAAPIAAEPPAPVTRTAAPSASSALPSPAVAPSEPAAPATAAARKAPLPHAAVPPAHTQKPPRNATPAPAPSPRNTSTDMGF